jgi:threonine/homoserine/homoserine lactone efflux protein
VLASSPLPPPETLAVFLVAAVALILTPGPDTLFVLTQGVADRGQGVRAALGVATGVLVHTLGVALGLAALFRAVPLAFDVVTYLGAAYLLVLGVQTIRATPAVTDQVDANRPGADGTDANRTGADVDPDARGYRRGVLVNVLNPKVALFFLAFLPGFAASATGMVALGSLYAVITAGYLSLVALLAGRASGFLSSKPAQVWLNRLAATALVGLAVLVIVGH